MSRRFAWVLVALLAVATVVGVGAFAYHAGAAHALATNGHALDGPGGAGPMGWHGPWRHGFGFFPFFPLFFLILFLIFALRGLFWRGAYWGRGWDYGYGGIPPAFEEWHRRAHAQPAGPPPPTGSNV